MPEAIIGVSFKQSCIATGKDIWEENQMLLAVYLQRHTHSKMHERSNTLYSVHLRSLMQSKATHLLACPRVALEIAFPCI